MKNVGNSSRGRSQESWTFSGLHIGRIAQSSLRQHSFLVISPIATAWHVRYRAVIECLTLYWRTNRHSGWYTAEWLSCRVMMSLVVCLARHGQTDDTRKHARHTLATLDRVHSYHRLIAVWLWGRPHKPAPTWPHRELWGTHAVRGHVDIDVIGDYFNSTIRRRTPDYWQCY